MTDEEKNAIEDLKEVIELYNDKCLITTEDDIKSIKILLNLIEKQSKEIEELKTTKKELTERVLRLESDKFWDNVVSKDKIKAKIEEYEQDVKDFEEYWSKDPRKFKKEKSVDYYKLEALKELLEKE